MGVHVVDHPLVQHKLSILRDRRTGNKEFRELMEEVAMLLAYEVTRDLPTEPVRVETPLAAMEGRRLAGEKVGVIPILRAGLGMVPGILRLIPTAKVGHLGLYRNEETLEPVEYYWKLPAGYQDRILIVLDPMLATGGSACAAVDFLKAKGAARIKFLALIAAPEGVRALSGRHPDVDIWVAAVDSCLNERGFIVPGLGDAGDRLFGTDAHG